MIRVFIDGSAGTTGLRIRERLSGRKDLELLLLPEAVRKDPSARQEALNGADVSFLCLPDTAAREAVSLVSSPHAVIIDTSTAHRTAPGWTYGFPELRGQREKIRSSRRIANPGCHATGFLALIAPLTACGALKKDVRLSCFSLTGYSGGGKKMIAEYESADRSPLLAAPRPYGLSQQHKHLPEMALYAGLEHSPVFCPIVGDFDAGMETLIPLTPAETSCSPEELRRIFRDYYQGSALIRLREDDPESGFLSAGALSGRDDLEIRALGQPERMLLSARFDNLGKGASGAAIENMNLALGLCETEGLVVCPDE